VLLDFLDASLDHVEDTRERQRALALAGFRPRVIVVGSDAGACDAGGEGPRETVCAGARDWPRALREAGTAAPGATLFVCGLDDPGRGSRVRRSWSGPVERWPTLLSGEESADRLALALAVGARSAGARTSLWDGAYLLAPSAPRGPDGERLLELFAELTEEHDMLDLVVLDELSVDLQGHARSLGVGLRVHGVGRAPLRAECTWLAGAAAVLVGAGSMPGLATLLRALAGPAPLLAAGDGPAARALCAWLEPHGASPIPGGEALAALPGALRQALSRSAEVRAAVERGAGLAATYTTDAAAANLRRLSEGAVPLAA
jgi:hypothetical protein